MKKVVVSKEDPHGLYNFEPTNTESLFYIKIVPNAKPVGCLVILPSTGELVESVMNQITLHELAVQQDLLVIFPSVNWSSAKFTDAHEFLDTVFKMVVEEYEIPKDKFVLGGLSLGGMISLTYAEKANREKGSTFIDPKAVFALDPPLDFAHLYHQAERDVERNFSEAAVSEGKWLMEMYETEFGGTPEEVPAEYIKYSIYSHSEEDGGNAKYLIGTPVKIYTEPAIEWQIKNRQRDLYDLNATDISAMINLLQRKGNNHAEIIVTHGKGIRPDGTKHPHSWSIMDSRECLSWAMEHL
ncbi:alpha/beta hydrolase family protein [Salinimicrobium sp. CAU 1759]